MVSTPRAWDQIGADSPSSQVVLEDRETLAVLRDSVRSDLTPHQREVLTALAINGIPIDVLAERCGTTRGALYKTLHDARRELRLALDGAGAPSDDLRSPPASRSATAPKTVL